MDVGEATTPFFVPFLLASIILLRESLNFHISHPVIKLRRNSVKAPSQEQERKMWTTDL